MPATRLPARKPRRQRRVVTSIEVWAASKHPAQPCRYRLLTPCCEVGTVVTSVQLASARSTGLEITCGRSLWGAKRHPPRGCGTHWHVEVMAYIDGEPARLAWTHELDD